MESSEHRYYKLIKVFLTVIGLWPRFRIVHSSCMLFIAIIVFVSQVAPMIIAAIMHRDDIIAVMEDVLALIVISILFVKGIYCVWNSKNISKLFKHINTDWKIWIRYQEVDILHQYAEQSRIMMYAWVAVYYSLGAIFTTQPAIPKFISTVLKNGTKPGVFPIPVEYYYFDGQKYYFYIIAYMFASLSFGFLWAMAMDCLLILSVQHCCSIFAALGCKITKMGMSVTRSDEEVNEWDKTDVNVELLSWCIKRHNAAIDYAELIESTFSWSFFVTVGLNMLLISVSGYQIAIFSASPQELMRFIAAIIAALAHIFIENYMAQILMDHSISIHFSIYSSNWYMQSKQVQMLLSLMMMRCTVPCKLTAGKISIMCLETFTRILNTSMSCLMLLRSI